MQDILLIYNSHGLVLASNEPFESKNKAITEGKDIISQEILKENVANRKTVRDTDIGDKLQGEIDDLKRLLFAYSNGNLKEER